jgi:hypothetical protein
MHGKIETDAPIAVGCSIKIGQLPELLPLLLEEQEAARAQ